MRRKAATKIGPCACGDIVAGPVRILRRQAPPRATTKSVAKPTSTPNVSPQPTQSGTANRYDCPRSRRHRESTTEGLGATIETNAVAPTPSAMATG